MTINTSYDKEYLFQQTFLGASVKNWNTSMGFNSNSTTVNVTLVEDEANTMKAEDDAKPTRADLKASAKAKLIAGEALTEDEANTKAAELSGSDSSGRKYIVKDIG